MEGEKRALLPPPVVDAVSGVVGGLFSIILGYPLDIARVRLQTSPSRYRGTAHCLSKLVREEGPAALYRGVTAPMVGVVGRASVGFFVFGSLVRFFKEMEGVSELNRNFLSGAGVGAVTMATLLPSERVKVLLQTTTASAAFKSPKDCARQLGVAAFFNAWPASAITDLFGCGVYFGGNEMLKDHFGVRSSLVGLAACGVGAGVMSWTSIYPADVVRSRMLADPWGERGGAVRVARAVYEEAGWRGFTKGYGPTIVRCIPADCGLFAGYGLTAHYLTLLSEGALFGE